MTICSRGDVNEQKWDGTDGTMGVWMDDWEFGNDDSTTRMTENIDGTRMDMDMV